VRGSDESAVGGLAVADLFFLRNDTRYARQPFLVAEGHLRRFTYRGSRTNHEALVVLQDRAAVVEREGGDAARERARSEAHLRIAGNDHEQIRPEGAHRIQDLGE